MDYTAQDSNETPVIRNGTPSEIPTVPAPRQTPSETRLVLLREYRAESARLTRLAATMKELGIDPQSAWDGASRG